MHRRRMSDLSRPRSRPAARKRAAAARTPSGSRRERRASQPRTYGRNVSRRVMVPSRSKTASRLSVMARAAAPGCSGGQLAQDEVQDAAVVHVFPLFRRVHAHVHLESRYRAIVARRAHGRLPAAGGEYVDTDLLLAVEPKRCCVLTGPDCLGYLA